MLPKDIARSGAGISASTKRIVKFDDNGTIVSCDTYRHLVGSERGKGTAVVEHHIGDSATR